MLLIVRSDKSLVGDRGKNKSTYQGEDLLPFEKSIFRNGHSVRSVDGIMFIAMTST